MHVLSQLRRNRTRLEREEYELEDDATLWESYITLQ
jgi:hypothetical protein